MLPREFETLICRGWLPGRCSDQKPHSLPPGSAIDHPGYWFAQSKSRQINIWASCQARGHRFIRAGDKHEKSGSIAAPYQSNHLSNDAQRILRGPYFGSTCKQMTITKSTCKQAGRRGRAFLTEIGQSSCRHLLSLTLALLQLQFCLPPRSTITSPSGLGYA